MGKIKVFEKKFKTAWFEWYWIAWVIVPILVLCNFFEIAIALLSVIFLTQKQQLEETRLFSELFRDFTKRYDKLNGRIADIKSQNSPCQEIDKTLADYFNLCAEEYLFYKEGRILDSVWGNWCRGMEEHLKSDIIRNYWEKEQKENTYYGLCTDVIGKGAKIDKADLSILAG
ncbi:MAG: hypothetical protein PHP01_00670 [Phycisphaerae bacterium]|nr:hypothetical protein [Phycisphaerae bacterium]